MMASFNEVFERTEKKYLLTADQYAALLPILASRMEVDEFGKTTVTSLYLDTPQDDLICRSLEKPVYKEKIRLRRYGALNTMCGDNDVFLEIKKKYKGVVYKRRIRLTWAAAEAFLAGQNYEDAVRLHPLADPVAQSESLSFRSVQISREIEAFAVAHGPLQASMSTACDRTAYRMRPAPVAIPLSTSGAHAKQRENAFSSSAASQGDLRITFDERIRYCDFHGKHRGPVTEVELLRPGMRLMEVKMTGSMPLWLSQAFAQLDIKPTSFSKYGESYKTICA